MVKHNIVVLKPVVYESLLAPRVPRWVGKVRPRGTLLLSRGACTEFYNTEFMNVNESIKLCTISVFQYCDYYVVI